MKKTKGILLLSLLLVMSLFVVACGSNNDENSNVGKGDNNSVSKNNDANDDNQSISGELELQYFVGGYGDAWWKQTIENFKEKYPDVEVIENAGPNINKEMQTRWISGNPPDFVYLGGAEMNEATMVEDGLLMDLTDWIKEIELENGNLLTEELLVQPHVYGDNKNYSVPYIFDTWGVWYDKNWFEDEGFIIPTDFDSWIESMKEIKEKEGIAPFTTTGMYPYYFLNGVLHSGIGIVGGDELLADIMTGAEGAWTSDEVLSVLEKVEKIRDEGLIDPGFAGINHTQSQMNFLGHKNAYIPVGFFLPNEMKEDVPDNFEFGFIPPPLNDSDEPMVLIPEVGSFGIAKDAKNPAAAKAFGEFIFSEENAVNLAVLSGGLPNLKGIDLQNNTDVPQYLKDVNDYVNVSGDVQLNYLPQKMSADLRNPIMDSLVSFLLGEIDAKGFAEEAEKAAEKYRNK